MFKVKLGIVVDRYPSKTYKDKIKLTTLSFFAKGDMLQKILAVLIGLLVCLSLLPQGFAAATSSLTKKAQDEQNKIPKLKQSSKKSTGTAVDVVAPNSSYLRLQDPKQEIRSQPNTIELRTGLQTIRINKEGKFLNQKYDLQPSGTQAAFVLSGGIMSKVDQMNLAHGPSLEVQVGSSEIDIITATGSLVPARLVSTAAELGYRFQTRSLSWTWELNPFLGVLQSTQTSSNSLAQDSGQASFAGLAATAMYDLDAQWGLYATIKSSSIIEKNGLDAIPQTNNLQTGLSYLW